MKPARVQAHIDLIMILGTTRSRRAIHHRHAVTAGVHPRFKHIASGRYKHVCPCQDGAKFGNKIRPNNDHSTFKISGLHIRETLIASSVHQRKLLRHKHTVESGHQLLACSRVSFDLSVNAWPCHQSSVNQGKMFVVIGGQQDSGVPITDQQDPRSSHCSKGRWRHSFYLGCEMLCVISKYLHDRTNQVTLRRVCTACRPIICLLEI